MQSCLTLCSARQESEALEQQITLIDIFMLKVSSHFLGASFTTVRACRREFPHLSIVKEVNEEKATHLSISARAHFWHCSISSFVTRLRVTEGVLR